MAGGRADAARSAAMLVQSLGPTILLRLAENHGQSNIWYGYNRFMYAAIRPLLQEKKTSYSWSKSWLLFLKATYRIYYVLCLTSPRLVPVWIRLLHWFYDFTLKIENVASYIFFFFFFFFAVYIPLKCPIIWSSGDNKNNTFNIM